MNLGSRPNVTQVQILTFVAALITTLTAFGLDLSTVQIKAILGLTAQLGTVALIADAAIRFARNLAHAWEMHSVLSDDARTVTQGATQNASDPESPPTGDPLAAI